LSTHPEQHPLPNNAMKFMQIGLTAVAVNGAAAASLRNSERDLQTVLYYPKRDNGFDEGYCTANDKYKDSGAGFTTELACCKAHFAGQQSGKCFSMLPNPPTTAPTGVDGPDIWYANYASFEIGSCINKAPAPVGRTIYKSQLECCKAYYGTQSSGYCLTQLPADERPTTAPTPVGGPDIWYANYDVDWEDGHCINKAPAPNGRTTYDSELKCCKGAYSGQASGACFASLPADERPTTAPTGVDGPDIWYANYDVDWAKGHCINKAPAPIGRNTYDSQLKCCKAYYGTQESGYCLTQLPADERPTTAPTPDGGPDIWYANYDVAWEDGHCINKAPAPIGRNTYDSQLKCCKGFYASQASGACLQNLPADERPTAAPTPDGGPDIWYANYDVAWEDGHCINKAPVPNGRNTYDSQLKCCKAQYGTQLSGACLQNLPADERPTTAPTGNDMRFFPIWSSWETGHCDNAPSKLTGGNTYFYDTQEECCHAWFNNQPSGACLQFDPTYGSRSPTQAPIQ
jgi:hypothetical protein